MPTAINKSGISAEVCYQNHLKQKALAKAQASPDHYRFDPQGHLLTEVTLAEEDYRHIVAAFHGVSAETLLDSEGESFQADLENLLGYPLPQPATTICNIDIKDNDTLRQQYYEWLTDVDPEPEVRPSTYRWWEQSYQALDDTRTRIRQEELENYRTKLNKAVNCLLTSENRQESSSINAIQEEMEMHIGLALQVLKKAFAEACPAECNTENWHQLWADVLAQAARDINNDVRSAYQRALVGSYDGQRLDFAAVNKTLAKARGTLAAKGYDHLVKHCQDKIRNFSALCEVPTIQKAITKKAFESTTASPHDYFTSTALGLSARIDGSSNTAHHKETGEGHQALRIIRYSDGSMMMRVPSIPNIADKKLTATDHIDDTQTKIAEIAQKLRAQLPNPVGPIILNRETSIPHYYLDTWKFLGGNCQARRLAIEIRAMHQFNRSQENANQWFLIQGIGVNQHTQALSENKAGILKEATLMAEIAMLANLSQQFPGSPLADAYQDIAQHYQTFLSNQDQTVLGDRKVKDLELDTRALFSESTLGRSAFDRLRALKETLKNSGTNINASNPFTEDLKTLASQALVQIFAHNLHRDPRYGMLVQALSTFTQNATVAGCKSANERFYAVEARAALLRLLNQGDCPLVDTKNALIAAFKAFIGHPQHIQSLQRTLDESHNKHSLQIRSAAAVSCLDQGAAAKLKAFVKGREWRTVDTNSAESSSLNRLHSKGTSEMQAHKGNHAQVLLTKIQATERKEIRTFERGSNIGNLLFLLKEKQQGLQANTRWWNSSAKKRLARLEQLIREIENPFVAFTNDENGFSRLILDIKRIFIKDSKTLREFSSFFAENNPDAFCLAARSIQLTTAPTPATAPVSATSDQAAAPAQLDPNKQPPICASTKALASIGSAEPSFFKRISNSFYAVVGVAGVAVASLSPDIVAAIKAIGNTLFGFTGS